MIHVWLATQHGALRVWDASLQLWATLPSWQALEGGGFTSGISSRAKDTQVCLYVPTQMTLTLSNELGTSQLKQLGVSGQQYLFEDLALTPVEHLRVRHTTQGDRQHFYALSAQDIEQWQQSAQLVGLKVVALLPDFVLLPTVDARLAPDVALYQDAQTLLLRYGAAQGVALSHLALLPKLLANIDEIVYLSAAYSLQDAAAVAIGNTDDSDNQRLQKLQQICDTGGIVLTPSTQALLPVALPSKHALNFVEVKRTRLASPYLTLAAGVLLLAGVVQIAADGLQWYYYQQAAITTKTATEAQFASWFVDERLNPRVDVVLQVKPRLLSGEVAKQSQLETLNRVSPIIKQSNLVAQSLRWNDADIAIVVIGDRREDIDTMQRALSEQGIVANLGAINPTSDGGVIGEINIPLPSSNAASKATSTPPKVS